MKKKYKVLIIIAVVLIVFRLILPFIVLHYANKTLSNMPGYYGHIDDIDISLILGAYEIKDIFINKQIISTTARTDKKIDQKKPTKNTEIKPAQSGEDEEETVTSSEIASLQAKLAQQRQAYAKF